MPFKYTYKFTIKHDRSYAWHIGAHLCVDPHWSDGKKEVYLFFCVGKHDFSIGFLHIWNEEREGEQ